MTTREANKYAATGPVHVVMKNGERFDEQLMLYTLAATEQRAGMEEQGRGLWGIVRFSSGREVLAKDIERME